MAKRRFTIFRRPDDESTTATDPGGSEESSNGAPDATPVMPADPPTALFDREADADDFTVPGAEAAQGDDDPESDDFTPSGRPGDASAGTKGVTAWKIDDGSEQEPPPLLQERPQSFVPDETDPESAAEPAERPAEPVEPALEPSDPPAEPADPPSDEAEAFVPAGLTSSEAPDAAPRPPAPSATETAGTSAAALEEQARTGAAKWLRDQVRQIERTADERVKAAEKASSANPEDVAAEHGKDLGAEVERIKKEADERVREAEERHAAELRKRDEELESEREEKARLIESSDRRMREIEDQALAAADRVAAAEQELAKEADRLRREAEERAPRTTHDAELAEELERVRSEAASNLQREVAAARATTEMEARETLRVREEELIRQRAAIEGELAATRRQLDEAHERAAAAERRAIEIEIEARREVSPEPPEAEPESAPAPEPEQPPEGTLSLSSASFDELRDLGMSVTQAKRVIGYREENDGFEAVDELERVPGFPRAFLAAVRDRLVP